MALKRKSSHLLNEPLKERSLYLGFIIFIVNPSQAFRLRLIQTVSLGGQVRTRCQLSSKFLVGLVGQRNLSRTTNIRFTPRNGKITHIPANPMARRCLLRSSSEGAGHGGGGPISSGELRVDLVVTRLLHYGQTPETTS